MEQRIRVAVAPTHDSTLLLATDPNGYEILRARLAPPCMIHRLAAATFLEGLALWCQRPLFVALAVDDEAFSSGLQLSGGSGFGVTTALYNVKVIQRHGTACPDFRQLLWICRREAR